MSVFKFSFQTAHSCRKTRNISGHILPLIWLRGHKKQLVTPALYAALFSFISHWLMSLYVRNETTFLLVHFLCAPLPLMLSVGRRWGLWDADSGTLGWCGGSERCIELLRTPPSVTHSYVSFLCLLLLSHAGSPTPTWFHSSTFWIHLKISLFNCLHV